VRNGHLSEKEAEDRTWRGIKMRRRVNDGLRYSIYSRHIFRNSYYVPNVLSKGR